MLTTAQARAQRRALVKDIARDRRKQQRETLAHLRQQIRDARAARKSALRLAKEHCKGQRVAARARARVLRARVLEELHEAVRLERS
jgi:hypothetical protein